MRVRRVKSAPSPSVAVQYSIAWELKYQLVELISRVLERNQKHLH